MSLAMSKWMSFCKPIQGNSTQWVLLALGVLLTAVLGNLPVRADVLGIESKTRIIENEYNIKIHHNYDAKTFFPSRWLRSPISARGKHLSAQEVARTLPIIEEFLSVYPKRVLQGNLKSIYLLGELTFYGKSFGASNGNSGLYIKSREADNGFTEAFLVSRMHSEFSSILMRNYSFPTQEWKNINRANFQYVGDGVQTLDQPNQYGRTTELLSGGFIVKYAQSSIENDFNMISDWLFTRHDRLKKLADKFPRIDAKMRLAIKFYRSIDNRITFD